jgi:molybdopterin converting factor small subunit
MDLDLKKHWKSLNELWDGFLGFCNKRIVTNLLLHDLMSDKIIYSNALKCKNSLYGLISELQQQYTVVQYHHTNTTLVQFHSFIQDLQHCIKRQVTHEKKVLLQEKCNELVKEYELVLHQLQQLKQVQDSVEVQRRQLERQQLGLQQELHQRKETTSFLDLDIKEDRVMNYTSSSVDQYITMGSSALQELYEQRSMLKVFIDNLVNSETIVGRGDEIRPLVDCDSVY